VTLGNFGVSPQGDGVMKYGRDINNFPSNSIPAGFQRWVRRLQGLCPVKSQVPARFYQWVLVVGLRILLRPFIGFTAGIKVGAAGVEGNSISPVVLPSGTPLA